MHTSLLKWLELLQWNLRYEHSPERRLPLGESTCYQKPMWQWLNRDRDTIVCQPGYLTTIWCPAFDKLAGTITMYFFPTPKLTWYWNWKVEARNRNDYRISRNGGKPRHCWLNHSNALNKILIIDRHEWILETLRFLSSQAKPQGIIIINTNPISSVWLAMWFIVHSNHVLMGKQEKVIARENERWKIRSCILLERNWAHLSPMSIKLAYGILYLAQLSPESKSSFIAFFSL